MKNNLRIAISGTYSTGKTTTSYALSFLSGIPRTHAQTMREILPTIFPGKRLEDCTPPDLCELGMRRLTERVMCESVLQNGYISDGSALHEWVYGVGRLKVGLNPNDNFIEKVATNFKYILSHNNLKRFLSFYGDLVKKHTLKSYDIFVHLPIEFGISNDGHRPVNEKFRLISDELLMQTIKELNIPYVIASGSVETRLRIITEALKLPKIISFEEAIELWSS